MTTQQSSSATVVLDTGETVERPRYVERIRDKWRYHPSSAMKEKGFSFLTFGPTLTAKDIDRVKSLNADWDAVCLATAEAAPLSEYGYPIGSIGWAFKKWMADRTVLFTIQGKPARRECDDDWHRAWKHIDPEFGRLKPADVTMQRLAELRAKLSASSEHSAYLVIKIWRALWVKMARYGLCSMDADPSKLFSNPMPEGRTAVWYYPEVVRLVKRAIRMKYYGLACAIAVAWDTQLSPIDVLRLTPGSLCFDGRGYFFDCDRAKTSKDAIGTLSPRTMRLLRWYAGQLGAILLDNSPIFRTRGTYRNVSATSPHSCVDLILNALDDGPLGRAEIVECVLRLHAERRANSELRKQTIDSALYAMKQAPASITQDAAGLYTVADAPDAAITETSRWTSRPYTRNHLDRDFRILRVAEFGEDETRKIMDLRRSGTVEASAGGASDEIIGQKMANNFASNKFLRKTYNPKQVTKVRLADDAREVGRQRLRDGENAVQSGRSLLGGV